MPKHDTPAKIAAERYRWMVLDWSVLNDCWIVRPWLYSDPPRSGANCPQLQRADNRTPHRSPPAAEGEAIMMTKAEIVATLRTEAKVNKAISRHETADTMTKLADAVSALPDASPLANTHAITVPAGMVSAESLAEFSRGPMMVESPRISDREQEMWGLLQKMSDLASEHEHAFIEQGKRCVACGEVALAEQFIETHRHEFERTEANQSSKATDPRATHRSRTSSGEGADDPGAVGEA